MAATGDLQNNLNKLQAELKAIDFKNFKIESVSRGEARALLDVFQYVLLDYSRLIAQFLQSQNYDLYATSDERFAEGIFRVMRAEFSYRPSLTPKQFLATGFAERKLIFVCDAIKLCRRKHLELSRQMQKSMSRKKIWDTTTTSKATATVPHQPHTTTLQTAPNNNSNSQHHHHHHHHHPSSPPVPPINSSSKNDSSVALLSSSQSPSSSFAFPSTTATLLLNTSGGTAATTASGGGGGGYYNSPIVHPSPYTPAVVVRINNFVLLFVCFSRWNHSTTHHHHCGC